MRSILCVLALLASLAPGMAQTTPCQNAAALPPSIAANLTTKINNALLPNANKSYSNSTQGAYVSFTTPAICWSGNWFGFKVIPSGCLSGIGGKTYQGSTGRTTTVTGIYGLSVAINASQTSCSSSTGVIKTTNAFTATATWPPVTLKMTLDWYPLVGGSTGIGVTVNVNGLKMVMQGSYGYNATSSPKQTCITSAAVSSTVISYSSISGQFTINGGSAGALPTKVLNKIGSSITSKGAQVTNSVNNKLQHLVGTCQTSVPSSG